MYQAYAIEYRNLYQRHWWWRSREEEILRQLKHWLGLSTDHSILDVGCGDGLFFNELQKFGTVTGVEADVHTLSPNSPWQSHIHCQLFNRNFQPNQNYSAILMLDILEHMTDPAEALDHARSLLRTDGYLIVTVPAFMSLWTSHDDLNHHHIRFTKQTMAPLFEQTSLEIVSTRYLFHWTCPVKLLLRLKEKIFGADPSNPQVPPAWINQICWTLTRCEQATISKLPMPFGSSLLVVAKPV